MNTNIILLLSLFACTPRHYMDDCGTTNDCANDQVCEMVVSLGYLALNDTGGGGDTASMTGPVCTYTCTSDQDCPKSTECSDDDGGKAHDTCHDGLCTPANCI
jgi:hypothetical protein